MGGETWSCHMVGQGHCVKLYQPMRFKQNYFRYAEIIQGARKSWKIKSKGQFWKLRFEYLLIQSRSNQNQGWNSQNQAKSVLSFIDLSENKDFMETAWNNSCYGGPLLGKYFNMIHIKF